MSFKIYRANYYVKCIPGNKMDTCQNLIENRLNGIEKYLCTLFIIAYTPMTQGNKVFPSLSRIRLFYCLSSEDMIRITPRT